VDMLHIEGWDAARNTRAILPAAISVIDHLEEDADEAR
jgi:hypothetical protein